MAFGETVECLASEEFLGNLPFELDAVGTVPGWAMQIARRHGVKRAIVALAHRLAVIKHRIWVDGTEFRWTREQTCGSSMNNLQDPIQ